MSICLFAGGHGVLVAATAFTLSWTHSVEKVRWEEDWELTEAGLIVVESRVVGSGAGMEVPDGAVLKDGAWTYRPSLAPLPKLVLARSGATGGGWRICSERGCADVAESAGSAPAEIRRCE